MTLHFKYVPQTLTLLVIGMVFAHSLPVRAATPTGLQIAPLRSKPSQNPGDTSTGQLTVTNNTPDSMIVTLSVERFKVTDEDYHYDFAPGEYTEWVRLADTKVTLESKANKQIAYSLAVPANAPPGGYYFAIFASTQNDASTTNFKEIKRVASLVYLEVSGQLDKKVNLLGFDTPWFLTHRTLNIDNRLANQGNTHVDARLKQTINPLLGHGPEAVQKDGLILPSTIRKLSSTVKTPWLPGIYLLQVQFSPPQGGPTQSFSQIIVYFPVWAWLVLALLAVAILFGIISKKKKHRH